MTVVAWKWFCGGCGKSAEGTVEAPPVGWAQGTHRVACSPECLAIVTSAGARAAADILRRMDGQDLLTPDDADRAALEAVSAARTRVDPAAAAARAELPLSDLDLQYGADGAASTSRRCLRPQCDAPIDPRTLDGADWGYAVEAAAMIAGYCSGECQRDHAVALVALGRVWWKRGRR